jgi:hypothetical protein
MKTTKTIEIEVCERCGQETKLRECSRCKREICDYCAEVFHAAVEHYKPVSATPEGFCGFTINRVYEKFNGRYCTECSTKVIKMLRLFGLIASDPITLPLGR